MNTAMAKQTKPSTNRFDVKRLVFTAMMAALSIILSELLSFKVPIMPSFISFDLSDVPAVMAALTMGPVSGVTVCLIKNLEGLFTTMTGGVGELSNFVLSASLVLPAGLVARKTQRYSMVIIGCLCGALLSALISIASNAFVVFPAYSTAFGLNIDAIVKMYSAILPSADTMIECLLIFNAPFTFAKGAIAALISVPLFKRLRPVFNSLNRD